MLGLSDKDLIAVDLGSTGIRLVKLSKQGNSYQLVSFASVAIPANALASDSQLDKQSIATIITKLVKSSRVKVGSVVTALPSADVFTTVVKMPPMSASELERAVGYQVEQNIPLKIDDVRVSWQTIRVNKETNESAVMIIAAPKAKVDKYLEIFSLANLDVIAMETSSIAVARSLVASSDPLVLVLDIGGLHTDISIVENGIVSLTRSLPVGGVVFTRAISQQLGLDLAQAEQFKIKFGLAQDKLEGQVYRSMQPQITAIMNEVQRSVSFYKEQYGSAVPKIILTGNGSRLLGLGNYIKMLTNLEVVYGNPWSKIKYSQDVANNLSLNAPEFGAVVGLALRENK